MPKGGVGDGLWAHPRRKFSEFSALNHAFTLSVDFECRLMKMLMHKGAVYLLMIYILLFQNKQNV